MESLTILIMSINFKCLNRFGDYFINLLHLLFNTFFLRQTSSIILRCIIEKRQQNENRNHK